MKSTLERQSSSQLRTRMGEHEGDWRMGRTEGNTLEAYSNQYIVHWECLEVMVIQESRGTM